MTEGRRQAPAALRLVDGAVSAAPGIRISALELELRAGETGALLGATGSGKTTLVRAIAGLAPLQSGQLFLGDSLVDGGAGGRVPAHRRSASLAPQDLQLMTDRRVADNLALGLHRLSPAARRRRSQECLEVLGLTELADRRAGRLSGGQMRLVALARALAPAPALVLLDEPTAGLDRALKEVLPTLVRRLLPPSTAVFMTTHDFDEAFLWAQKIGVLAGGTLLAWRDAARLWRDPGSAQVAVAAGLGDLLRAEIGPVAEDGSVQVRTAAGAVQMPVSPALHKGELSLLVRPGELVPGSPGMPQARVGDFEVRGGRPGVRAELLDSGERCWLLCDPEAEWPAPGSTVPVQLGCRRPLLLPDHPER